MRFIVDHVRWFFSSSWFSSQHKTKLHIIQIVLVILMIGVVGGRIATIPEGRKVGRGDTLGIVMVFESRFASNWTDWPRRRVSKRCALSRTKWWPRMLIASKNGLASRHMRFLTLWRLSSGWQSSLLHSWASLDTIRVSATGYYGLLS